MAAGVAAGQPPPVSFSDETYASGALPAAAAHAVNTPRSVRACQLCGVTPAELAATAPDPHLPDRLRSALLRQARLHHRRLLARARPKTARDDARNVECGGGGGGGGGGSDAASCLSGGSGGSGCGGRCAAAARRRLEQRRRCELGLLVARGLASRECEAALAARAGRACVRREAGRRAAAARRRERRAARSREQQRRRTELLRRQEVEGREAEAAIAAAAAAAAAATSSPRGQRKRRKEASRQKKRPSPSPPPPPPPPRKPPQSPPPQQQRRPTLRAAASAAELRRRLEKGAAFELREARRAGEAEAAACAGRERSAAARARSAQQARAGQLLARHRHQERVAGVLEALRRGCPAEAVAAAVPGIVMPEPPAEARPPLGRSRGRQGDGGDGDEKVVRKPRRRLVDVRTAVAEGEGEETVEEVLRRVGLLSPGGGGGSLEKGGVGVEEGTAEQRRYYSQWMYD